MLRDGERSREQAKKSRTVREIAVYCLTVNDHLSRKIYLQFREKDCDRTPNKRLALYGVPQGMIFGPHLFVH